MNFGWSTFSKKFWLLSILFLTLVMWFLYWFYQSQVTLAQKNEFHQYQRYLADTIDGLVEEKQRTTQALALAFSAPIDFRRILAMKETSPAVIHAELKSFTDKLTEFTEYKNIWIQVIDRNGVSLGRSWTSAHGDNLVSVRKDIADVLKNPRMINSFSVGKFALTFKSIVPIYDEDSRFLGVLDVISQVNSIDKALSKASRVRSVVLVDKSYQKQLTKVSKDRFIDGYYVANAFAKKQDMDLIAHVGANKIFGAEGFQLVDNTLVTVTPLRNIFGQKIAVWVSLKPIEEFKFISVKNLYHNYIMIAVGVVIFIFLLLWLIYFRQKSDFERRFFYQVFDESTEVICVVDQKNVIQANRQFFDLFDSIDSIEEFHANYDCICELFVEEEGYLSQYINGVHWYDYLMSNRSEDVFAKIETKGQLRTFKVKANSIGSGFGSDYVSILMTDITEEIHYKEELEHLIIHDELTGVYNRHYFNEALADEIKRAHRYGTPMSIVMFDIDHFKNVNDDFGHDIGDRVLQNLAHEVQHQLRDTDKLCRVGGEEFCILMPETHVEGAVHIAERLSHTISNLSLTDIPRQVTISIGVTELNRWDNEMSIYKRVDIALYKAKNDGRNRIEVLND